MINKKGEKMSYKDLFLLVVFIYLVVGFIYTTLFTEENNNK